MSKQSHQHGKITFNEIKKEIAELKPDVDKKYCKGDDISFGRLFSDIFKNYARYNATAKEWYFYNGIKWDKDTGSMIVSKYMKMLSEALAIYTCTSESTEFRKAAFRLGNLNNRKHIIEDARDFNFITSEDLDSDPSLFNCKNCVINLLTLEVLEHDPAYLLSKVSNVYYSQDAISQDFLKFLSEVMQGDNDKIDYLQKIFGYALTGENYLEQCYMIYGSTTRNGKSTLLDVVSYMFGDYARNIQPESLALKDKNSRSASGDIARLDGCRFLHMSEPPKRMKFDSALLKTLLGRDKITARNLYERDFEFIPVFKLFINTNYLPVVTDDTLFSSGRVKVVSFDKHFSLEEQDPQLKGKLKTKENISGIFTWCLQGLKNFYKDGKTIVEPVAVKNATEDYRRKSDKIQNFIDERLIRNAASVITVKDAYKCFEQWCHDNGYGVENKGNFMEELKGKDLVSASGTVNGISVHNVIKGYDFDTYFDD